MSRSRLTAARLYGGGAVVLVAIIAAVAPGLLTHANPLTMGSHTLAGMGPYGTLGTDEYGRSILTRLIYGARPAIEVTLASVTIAAVLGTLAGVAGGYFAGLTEIFTMRGSDIVLCFPPILLAMLVVGTLGAGVPHLILIIGFLYIPRFARLAFAQTVSVKELEFVEAARAVGASEWYIVLTQVLPNIIGPLIVQASLACSSALLLSSGLSFLGLGVNPPTPSWGLMVASARKYMAQDPNFVFWPSLVLSITILAFNTLGDGLQQRLDPRSRGGASYL